MNQEGSIAIEAKRAEIYKLSRFSHRLFLTFALRVALYLPNPEFSIKKTRGKINHSRFSVSLLNMKSGALRNAKQPAHFHACYIGIACS
ncbi:hypothetical protein [Dapis sp. BLCC M126]|uniref:hypothetical protein n=1 Tax=Dapis sp. BLCC M126 TaxID=3400189 RepID=UPI003CEF5A89